MTIPVQITFRDMDPSGAIADAARDHAGKLAGSHERILACHVVVESPHHRHRKGNDFRVRVELSVPGDELVAESTVRENAGHQDAYLALRDAFRAVGRRLHERAERHGGRSKPGDRPIAGQ